MRYAFTFDASACTGCKSCQVACKDKNALPDGVLWRRVYEVSGGRWEQRGAAWINNVFAYNVSVGCNHCDDPACVAACPTNAYIVRDDGLVWLDGWRCVGCEYCAWVCPYGAPQYSAQLGRMTKCDGCYDLIDTGFAPSCVSACPLRALDFVRTDGPLPASNYQPFPLPAISRTSPQLVVKPHRAMLNDLPKTVANYEEVRPADARYQMPGTRSERTQNRQPGTFRTRRLASGIWHLVPRIWNLASGIWPLTDLPLVFFTLLAQAAAGAAIVGLFSSSPSRLLLGVIGMLTALAALTSLFHLGTLSNAWRSTANAKRSSLSREIVMLGVFAAAWVIALFAPASGRVLLAAAGVGLLFAMSEVYRVGAVTGWRPWQTRTAFAISALLLGTAAVLATTGAAHPWLFSAVTVAVFVDQAVRRWRFYGARLRKTM